ncbi:MAG: FKBP-type peptidyl-prolyl cis-trans isomerase [Prevotella sp.]
MNKTIYTLLILALTAMLAACSETNEETNEFDNWQERNDAFFTSIYEKARAAQQSGDNSWRIIRAYTKNTETTAIADHVVAHVLTEGDATAEPTLYTDSVAIHYSGSLMPSASYPEGYLFDSSWTGDYNLETMTVSKGVASMYIDGFTTALMAMKPGDRWEVYIPYALGYGTSSQSTIPAYSTLKFDITLVRAWKKRI